MAPSARFFSGAFDPTMLTELEDAVIVYLVLRYRASLEGEAAFLEIMDMMTEAWAARYAGGGLAWDMDLMRLLGVRAELGSDWMTVAVVLTLEDVRQHLGEEALRRVIAAVRAGYLQRAAAAVADPALPRSSDVDYPGLLDAQARLLLDAVAREAGSADVHRRAEERLQHALQVLGQ